EPMVNSVRASCRTLSIRIPRTWILKAFTVYKTLGRPGREISFDMSSSPYTPQRPYVATSVQTALTRVPGGAAPSENTAHSTRPLFYYGYSRRRGSPIQAFLLKDDEIYLANKGELIQDRYLIAELSAGSLILEDVRSGSRETVPLIGPY